MDAAYYAGRVSAGAEQTVLDRFSPAVREWFTARHRAPTRVQAMGWPRIAAGEHALLCAPTGSGKTLAAFLACLDRLGGGPPAATPGTRVLYISPLKALAYDIERNLAAPLAEIAELARSRGLDFRPPGVGVRTGDTSPAARRRQLREPPDILITTPESFYLLLTQDARAGLATVETVIVDEIHALAPNKRGAHLSLSLERLSALCPREPQRVGLSATQRPLEEVARYLGGDREVAVVDAGEPPRLEVRIEVPAADMTRPGGVDGAPTDPDMPGLSAEERTSLMPALYRRIHELVRAHRSSIVFVNSRRLAERVAHQLNEMEGEELARAHHGSMARGERLAAEDLLKRGLLRAIAATSSLELGIDMAAVDLVIQLESPGSVARGLQRIGRAGHQVGEVSRGAVLPKFRGDLLEAAVVCHGMQSGDVEPIRVPRQPLDVLAQQIVAMCAMEAWPVDQLGSVVRRAYPYRDLSRAALAAVLDMLSGAYPSDDMADLAPRLSWDRAADQVVGRRGARLIALTSGGTIPDRGLYPVHLGQDGPRVGELDEEMVYESRAGETFLLGATSWRIEEIERDRVIVSPAPGEAGKMPFWRGDRPPRPPALGRALGALVRVLGDSTADDARRLLAGEYRLDAFAVDNALDYVREQREATGTLPTDRAITVERFRDQLGDFRVCVLSPLGGAVHGPWALAIEAALAASVSGPVQTLWSDDGIAFRLPDSERPPDLDVLLFDPDEIEDRIVAELGGSAMFASRFRENAARALLMPRRRPGQRAPLWAQRLRAQQLLGAAQRHPSFPILLETYREILRDVFDMPALIELMASIRRGEVRVDVVDTASPSPFARSLAFAYTAAFMYEGDAPPAERRAQALALDRTLLRDLLGHEDLRQLLDAGVVDQVERERQRLTPDRQARDADEVHDLLRRLGDLGEAEIAERAGADVGPWLAELERQKRAIRIEVAGQPRLAAAEDAPRYAAALAGDDAALDGLVARHARARGPLDPAELAARFGVPAARAEAAIDRLVAAGELERGGFRPGGHGVEVVHADVLRELRRRTLDELRRQVSPVDGAALGRFLPAWHGMGRGGPTAWAPPADRSAPRRGELVGATAWAPPADHSAPRRGELVGATAWAPPADRSAPRRGELVGPGGGMPALREAVRRLVGLPLPLSDLESRILPARVPDYHPSMLDQLGATGELLWIGCGRLGASDGRVALYDRDRLALVPLAAQDGDPAELPAEQRAIVDALAARGASFQVELESASGLAGDALIRALWDLVWAGLVTNDTFAPMRSRAARGKPAAAARRPRPGGRRAPGSVRVSPFAGGGRWSLVAQRARAVVDPTERALALALSLLDRYGLVSREAAVAEELAGGFSALSPVLRVLEETGRVRRGYFAAGLDGRQFALPAVIDRLRAPAGDDLAVALAACDPANPYGALLPWPEPRAADGGRPSRRAGALVLLWRGELALYLEAGGKAMLSFAAVSGDDLAAAMRAGMPLLTRLARRRAVRLETADGAPARSSPLAPLLIASGFRPEQRGLAFEPDRR
jgi:ATP-dependent Lhr-like helicase